MLKRLDHFLDKFEEYACFVTLFTMSLAVLTQIIFRSFLGRPFPWGEEGARYLMIWATFIAISAGVKAGTHIGVDVLVQSIPERLRRYVLVGTDLMVLAFFIIMLVLSVQLVLGIRATGQLSPAMRMPMWYAYAAFPVGFTLSSIRQFQKLMDRVANCWPVHQPDKKGEAL